MDKGIRVNVTAKFNELNTERLQGTLSNKAFRRDVMAYAIAEFDITVASAATHYNYSFKRARALDADSVATLGRAEDKKGGRKAKAQSTVIVNVFVDADGAAQEAYTVKKKSDNTVVGEGYTLEEARAIVCKNAAQKKAKLYWI